MHRPVHFEILADDPEQVGQFYSDLLGWEISTWEGGEGDYWLVGTGDRDAPGIDGGIMERHFKQAVINTVQVEDLPQLLDRVNELGGRTVHGPNEIPGVGMHAYCADPEGNLFGLMQPANQADQPG